VTYEQSQEITDKINHGDLSEKPGWVRWSLHPTMTFAEVDLMISALHDIVDHIEEYKMTISTITAGTALSIKMNRVMKS
jgi:hypothetical protein